MINRTLNREPPAWYVCQLTIHLRHRLQHPGDFFSVKGG